MYDIFTKLCNLSLHDSQSNSELIYFDVDTLTAIIINSVELCGIINLLLNMISC